MKPVIIGAGLAGLTVALSLAPMPVILLSSRKLGHDCASAWAQGGIAAAVGQDDNASLHAEDTFAAGAGLCDADIVHSVTGDGTRIIEKLLSYGVPFDRDEFGQLRLGLEAAHRRNRIVHATDATGAAVTNTLVAAARRTPSIEIIEDTNALDLLIENGAVAEVVIERDGKISVLRTSKVVLATGGAGALWQHTTNPLGSCGRGLLLAARAGAVLVDLEFMQFHPTAIDVGQDPMPLASEALRGDGCTLINDKGERFVDELQPRDIVARAIWTEHAAGRRVFLDGRTVLGNNFALRFPSIHATCLAAGFDPADTPIPVSPAAHYHMGGVQTDALGRTSVAGLWACGEVASTGLHGANRLASNSLLEAASFGRRVAEDIAGSTGGLKRMVGAERQVPAALTATPALTNNSAVRSIMSEHVGVLRNGSGLQAAIEKLTPLVHKSDMALLGLMIATAALRRTESRGSHYRTDFPAANTKWQHHQQMKLSHINPLLQNTSQRHAVGT